MKLVTFIGAGALLLLSAFILKNENTEQPSLYETKWILKKIYHKDSVEYVFTRAFIRFNQEKKTAGGNGSCNTFGSDIVIIGNTISFSNIFSTKMYCEGVQQTEDSFFKLLERVSWFEIKDKILTLYHDKERLMEFRSE